MRKLLLPLVVILIACALLGGSTAQAAPLADKCDPPFDEDGVARSAEECPCTTNPNDNLFCADATNYIIAKVTEMFKIGFAIYARHLGQTLSYVYGTFAILPLFMVWMYMAWLIFLFGAELNAAFHEVKRHDRFDRRVS